MDELQARHRKEQQDLRARIIQKKKNATKKTRKGVNDECDTLQRDLQERQKAEFDALTSDSVSVGMSGLDLKGAASRPEGEVLPENDTILPEPGPILDAEALSTAPDSPSQGSLERPKKPNRQKARLARRAAEQETLTVQAAEEAAGLPDRRALEMRAMQEHMEERGLKEIFIRPDGHCLYSAVATQLGEKQLRESGPYSLPYQNVRFTTANFVSEHPDDFLPFLEEPLGSYVEKIKDTAEWGGQLELQAITRAYGVEIKVLQADGRVEIIGSSATAPAGTIWLAYYRHSFGLGEHYNALEKAD